MWTGDCIDIMRGMNSESVDLIYLDPPFKLPREYGPDWFPALRSIQGHLGVDKL